MISLILHVEILSPIRPLLRIQPNLAVSIFLDQPVDPPFYIFMRQNEEQVYIL